MVLAKEAGPSRATSRSDAAELESARDRKAEIAGRGHQPDARSGVGRDALGKAIRSGAQYGRGEGGTTVKRGVRLGQSDRPMHVGHCRGAAVRRRASPTAASQGSR